MLSNESSDVNNVVLCLKYPTRVGKMSTAEILENGCKLHEIDILLKQENCYIVKRKQTMKSKERSPTVEVVNMEVCTDKDYIETSLKVLQPRTYKQGVTAGTYSHSPSCYNSPSHSQGSTRIHSKLSENDLFILLQLRNRVGRSRVGKVKCGKNDADDVDSLVLVLKKSLAEGFQMARDEKVVIKKMTEYYSHLESLLLDEPEEFKKQWGYNNQQEAEGEIRRRLNICKAMLKMNKRKCDTSETSSETSSVSSGGMTTIFKKQRIDDAYNLTCMNKECQAVLLSEQNLKTTSDMMKHMPVCPHCQNKLRIESVSYFMLFMLINHIQVLITFITVLNK